MIKLVGQGLPVDGFSCWRPLNNRGGRATQMESGSRAVAMGWVRHGSSVTTLPTPPMLPSLPINTHCQAEKGARAAPRTNRGGQGHTNRVRQSSRGIGWIGCLVTTLGAPPIRLSLPTNKQTEAEKGAMSVRQQSHAPGPGNSPASMQAPPATLEFHGSKWQGGLI